MQVDNYRTGSMAGAEMQGKLAKQYVQVLKVPTGETKDYAVDYELQVKQQVDQYRRGVLAESGGEDIVRVSFGRKSKAPIEEVKLNKTMKATRHYFKSKKFKEFVVFAIEYESKNLKRVLTLRTQFLLRNKTLFDYQIKIISLFDKQNSEIKELKVGECLPIPETYNQSLMKIKLRSEHDSDWSDEYQVYALKRIVDVDQPGYLRHGSTFTFFRKEQSDMDSEAFDIVLMPPLVLQNCLPVEVTVSFVDSNKQLQKIPLGKEETRNVFSFDLQQEIKLQVAVPGYSKALLKLDTRVEVKKESRVQLHMNDDAGRKLVLHVNLSSKAAGFKVQFHLTNCLINQTGQNLLFFYERPAKTLQVAEGDVPKMVTAPVDNGPQQLADDAIE